MRVLLAGAGLGGVVTVVSLLPGPVGLIAAITVLCTGAFLLWPWAVLPVGIIGGALLSGGDMRGFIAVKLLLLAAGGAALAVRHWLRVETVPEPTSAPTPSLQPIPATGSGTGSGRPERRPWSCPPRHRHR
ncbi:hypothetical protein [Micromonospora inaquosa]|uniref:hypothetical protein n=1 Tax=Micromonospora inaquosa TaxID=2203716 RepID=UPI000F5D6EF2|nr:hypothetical protein [Micromonospora inaquosa]